MIFIFSISNKYILYFSKYFVHVTRCIILLKIKFLVQDNFYKQQFKILINILYYNIYDDTIFNAINIVKLMQLMQTIFITFLEQNNDTKNVNTGKYYRGK